MDVVSVFVMADPPGHGRISQPSSRPATTQPAFSGTSSASILCIITAAVRNPDAGSVPGTVEVRAGSNGTADGMDTAWRR